MGLEYLYSHFLQEIIVIIVISKHFWKSVSGYSQMLKAYPAFYWPAIHHMAPAGKRCHPRPLLQHRSDAGYGHSAKTLL